nr:hypothetical protein [Thiobacillus sp.]
MILLDLNMKDMNGVDVLKAIRTKAPIPASSCSPCRTRRRI